MPESQLVKNSEQKSQDYLTEKPGDGNNYITIYNYNKSLPRILCSWKIVNPK